MSAMVSRKGNYAQVPRRDLPSKHPFTSTTSSNGRNENPKTSYRAPFTMLLAFIAGLGLALAQHFIYAHLDRQEVATIPVSQAWISRIGTGLAFATKVALTVCVGSAFIQHQWMRFQQQTFKVVEMDSLTGALGNILCLFESTVWWRFPVLAIIALVSWTIPLSAVVAPGSLSVEPLRNMTSIESLVPQPLYNFTNYGMYDGVNLVVSESNRLTRLIMATASSQGPVQLQSAHQNETYTLRFNGPAIKCRAANDSIIRNITGQYGQCSGDGDTVQFAAWAGSDQQRPWDPSEYYQNTLDTTVNEAALLSVMTNTGTWANPRGSLLNITESNYTYSCGKVNVTQCVLYNATYNVDFTFQYPNQTMNVEIAQWINPVVAITAPTDTSGDFTYTNSTDTLSYLAMMSAYGRLLIGNSTASHYQHITNTGTSWNIVNIDWTRAEAVQVGLEQLFQNFTLSLLSDSGLIKNSSNAEYIPINVETWPITYVYTRFDLLLAYGLSLLAALICSGFGMYAFVANNASYQNVFSTYLRATNNTGIENYIDRTDKGHDPLPKTLGQVKLNMGEASQGDEHVELSRRDRSQSTSFT